MMGYNEIRQSVVENAGACLFCGWEPEAQHVSRTESRQYDEEYFSVSCRECSARYENGRREWMKPTPPGEE